MDMDVTYQSNYRRQKHPGGFTLIELLVVVALMAILIGIAAPSFSELVQSNRLTAHVNAMVSDLNYARDVAVRRNKNVIVCKSPDGLNCSTSSRWEEGWIVFVDDDSDRQRGSTEDLIVIQPSLEISISYGAFPYHSRHYVLYYPNGRSLGNGTFTLCDNRGKSSAKALVLYKTGRLRSAHEMPDGSDLSCPTT